MAGCLSERVKEFPTAAKAGHASRIHQVAFRHFHRNNDRHLVVRTELSQKGCIMLSYVAVLLAGSMVVGQADVDRDERV